MKINLTLSKREFDVMEILWKSDKPCISSEIAALSNISISTVHTVINKLLEKNMIVVDEIVYSGKVLSRCYKPTISVSSYKMRKMIYSFKGLIDTDFSTSNFVAALLGQEKDARKIMNELDELEKMIREKREELAKASKENGNKQGEHK